MNVLEQSLVIILSIVLNANAIKFQKKVRPLPVFRAFPCGDESIVSVFQEGLGTGYNVTIKKDLGSATDIKLKFDSPAGVFLEDSARFASNQDDINNIFSIILLTNTSAFTFNVRGQAIPFAPPYLTSLKINDEEFCTHSNLTYFKDFPVGVLSNPDRQCGRRKIFHTELIHHGVGTKPGDWPWHAAILRLNETAYKYTCGGSLISKHFVLTAAHCVSIYGIPVTPEILNVLLGKYHLFQRDIAVQEIQVYEVHVHEGFRHTSLSNDIALLHLGTEAVFNNYVQPICLWTDSVYDKLSYTADGTVVGWGVDESDTLSSTLRAATMPLIPKLDCIYSKVVFYGNLLKDEKRFCAGYMNGTAVCNGDSGGGFVYFVPDVNDFSSTSVPGAYYIRGIVSNTLSKINTNLCDPNAYAIFTDVSKYLPWIHSIIDDPKYP